MKKQQITRKQHTVPNCFLKTFGEKLWIYDKESKSWCGNKISTKTISIIEYYYEHESFETNHIEKHLCKVESTWATYGKDKLLNNLNNDNYVLTIEDKIIWSMFIWVQSVRVPGALDDSEHCFNLLSDFIKNMGTEELNEWWNK